MTEPTNPNDPQELEDFLADAIGDTMDMDWTGRVGAKGVIRALEDEGLMIVRKDDLRDQFAGQALVGEMAAQGDSIASPVGLAKRAYAVADAMLEARRQ